MTIESISPTDTMSSTERLRSIRCAWVTPVLGVDGNLLYFGPLLRAIGPSFAEFRVLTAEFRGDVEAAGIRIERCGTFTRFYEAERAATNWREGYASGVSLTGPHVYRCLRASPVDLLIINEFSLFAFYAAMTKLRSRRIRVLWIVESKPRFSETCILRLARRWFRRLLVHFADFFLTNNQCGLDYLTEELGVAPNRVIARPYLVSDIASYGTCSELTRTPRRTQTGQPLRFLYVGGLLKRKGVQVAIDAARQLRESENTPFLLEVVGEGPYRAELERMVAEQKLNEIVKFHGRESYERLWAHYAAAHVFVFPTLADYRALAPFEALSSGLAIIASKNDGGAAETVDEGRNGFTFDPTSPSELAAHMRMILRNPEKVECFSRRSIEMAQAYTLEKSVATLKEAALAALEIESVDR